MKLSTLQKFILRKTLGSGRARTARNVLLDFYKNKKEMPAKDLQVKIITQSLERLIAKGLITGFGRKTQEKMFIDFIQLTAPGRKVARKLLGQQVSLPFPKRKKNKK